MNSFLVPANSKKGTLIFNLFLPADLIIFGTGLLISLILLAVSETTTDTGTVLLISLPGIITGILVVPIPNYHNVMCVLGNVYKFYFVERQQFKWKGWCAKNEFKD